MLRTLVLSVCFALSGSLAAAQANVLVVDDDGGPGVDYTHPNDAVNAALDRDIILIKGGTYQAQFGIPPVVFEIDGKSLTVIAEAGESVVFDQLLVRIKNIGPAQQVTMRGIDMNFSLMSIENCLGPVWIEGFDFTAPIFTSILGLPAIDAVAVDRLTLLRSQVRGSDGSFGTLQNGAGLRTEMSHVVAYDCLFTGGDAHDPTFGDFGQDGVRLRGGSMHASGCHFEGGDGHLGLPGGAGLHLEFFNPTATLLDCTFQGGNPGGPGIQTDSGSSTTLAPVSRSFEIPAPLREGTSANLHFEGVPGDLVSFNYAFQHGQIFSTLLNGSFLLQFPPTLTFLAGVVGATGTLDVPISISDLGAGVEGVVVYGQATFIEFGPTFTLGGASSTVLLDSSL